MNRQILQRKNLKWLALAVAILVVTQVFFVQQLIAALLFFSALFASLGAVALMFFALGHAWQIALDWTATQIHAFGHAVRQGHAHLNSAAAAGALAPVPARRTSLSWQPRK